ncbi:queuosine salvage protein-like isoform X2 [Nylanderia fulva]|uniref:queuosine salvage protein-like isoform X2 n=1 Tax=Nylanderia fulva TaxID=613905 RepID=UPI0010FB76C4|nr:queuosine salvage protein-like isoform X2 [Nylanderia fulva]
MANKKKKSSALDVKESLEAAKFIVENAKDVTINKENIKHFRTAEKKPLWDPKYYSKLTESELKHIFRSDDGETTIPLLNKRRMILHEVGNVLLKKYKGTFKNCVKKAKYNQDKLVKLLFDEFEPYRDEAKYKNKTVRLYTKANSLIKDIWACYKKKNMFHLNEEKMMSTIFIDYRSPIVLFYFGILTYSDKLLRKFTNNNQPLKHGDREELEIRACSLIAVNEIFEQIKVEWNQINPEYDRCISIIIDNFLLLYIAEYFHKYVYMYDQYPFHYITSVHY